MKAQDPATIKQLKYFHALVAERDINAMIKGMPENWLDLMCKLVQNLNSHGVEYVHSTSYFDKADVSKFISQLKNCEVKYLELPPSGTEAERMVINDLVHGGFDQCGPAGDPRSDVFLPGEVPNQHLADLPSPYPPSPFEVGKLEQWVEASKTTTPNPFKQQPLQDGMYKHPHTGHIYKVYHTVHGANQQVAKRLIINREYENGLPLKGGHVAAKFKYEGKAPLKFLRPSMKLSITDAAAFGKLYGVCCLCGRALTNELSIHLGIGPICGDREFGGEFEFMINQAKADLTGHDPSTVTFAGDN